MIETSILYSMLNWIIIIILRDALSTLVLKIILLAFNAFNIVHIDGVVNILTSGYCTF